MKGTALTLVTVLALPVWVTAGGALDQRRPAAPGGRVTIENMTGTIKVIGWDKAEVWVKGTLAPDAELDFSGSEDRTRIEVEAMGNPMAAHSDLEVHVPAGSRVEVEGFQATISVSGVVGTVDAETVNGSITQTGAAKEVNLQSVNGTIEVSSPSGRIEVEAVNGAVTVTNASGELKASTVNGKLVVTGGSFERASLESVAGGVEFDSGLSPRATLDVETVSGGVELRLPGAIGADFSVSTFSGDIENDFGPAAVKTTRFTAQKELAFSTGGGGTRISVQTLSGAVHLRKRP